jgi:hypothetical protein
MCWACPDARKHPILLVKGTQAGDVGTELVWFVEFMATALQAEVRVLTHFYERVF